MNTQIATRAAGSKTAYELVLLKLESIRVDVDACLKEESVGNSTQVISPTTNCASELNEVVSDDGDLGKVKGIKVKERLKGTGCSTRPKNALEKLTMSKRRRLENKDMNSSTGASKTASTTQSASTTTGSVPATQHVSTTQSLLPPHMTRVSNVQLTLPLTQPVTPSAPLLQAVLLLQFICIMTFNYLLLSIII